MSDAEPRLRIRATVVQTAPRLGDVAGNLDGCIVHLGQAAGEHSDLVVFPECALSGYMFSDEESDPQLHRTRPGPSTDALAAASPRTVSWPWACSSSTARACTTRRC